MSVCMFEHFAQLETLAQPTECKSWMLIGLELKLTLEFVVKNNIQCSLCCRNHTFHLYSNQRTIT